MLLVALHQEGDGSDGCREGTPALRLPLVTPRVDERKRDAQWIGWTFDFHVDALR